MHISEQMILYYSIWNNDPRRNHTSVFQRSGQKVFVRFGFVVSGKWTWFQFPSRHHKVDQRCCCCCCWLLVTRGNHVLIGQVVFGRENRGEKERRSNSERKRQGTETEIKQRTQTERDRLPWVVFAVKSVSINCLSLTDWPCKHTRLRKHQYIILLHDSQADVSNSVIRPPQTAARTSFFF